MTPYPFTFQALTAVPGPAWIHLVVMAFALLVLVRSLARHR
ncbi:hypothetical protein ACGFXC_05395 [Streptomyces sp. NPDC048507]